MATPWFPRRIGHRGARRERLRGQLDQLKKSGRFTDRSRISQLREPVWFATEYADFGTIEREDVSGVVGRLVALAPGHVTPELAQAWLDAARDF